MKNWRKISLIVLGLIVLLVISQVLFFHIYSFDRGFKIYCPSKPHSCLLCGNKVADIHYGYYIYHDGDEISEQIKNGDIVLGGCVVAYNYPEWECTTCGQKYWQAWKGLYREKSIFSFRLIDVLDEEDKK